MTLVILAAGLGSRFGGSKQLEPVGSNGEIILDFSVYDAIYSGFDRVLLLIRPEHYELFKENIGSRFEGKIKVEYAFQSLEKFASHVPEGRTKPWGTGHALLCCKEQLLHDNFAVINADDFYGRSAYTSLAGHFASGSSELCMVGYQMANTVTENGTVSRGVCVTDADGYLVSISEHKNIELTRGGDIVSHTAEGDVALSPSTVTSMNFFGFTPEFLPILEQGFYDFLETPHDELKGEYYLPSAVKLAMDAGHKVKVLQSDSKWYGVTYREDKPAVCAGIASLCEKGLYNQAADVPRL